MSRFPARTGATVSAVELPLLILISPLLLFPTPTRILAFLAVPVVWLWAWRTEGRLVPATPFNLALGVLLVMVAVSLHSTFDIRFSLDKISGVMLGVSFFWGVTRWTTTPRRLHLATATFIAAGTLLAILGLLGTDWPDKFPVVGALLGRVPKVIRGVRGAEGGFQPNAVAGCLVLFVPLQVALIATAPRVWRTLATHMLLLTLTAGTLFLTQSRGATLATLITAFIFLTLYNRMTRIVSLVILGGAALLAWAPGPYHLFQLPEYLAGRVEVWSRALRGIQDFPFTGMGMNAFRKVMPIEYPTVLALPDVDVAHAHNQLLQAALDLGIPGLVAYAAIWFVAAALVVSVYRRAPARSDRAIAAGLGGGLLAHFIFGLTDAIPLGAKPGVLFWFALALVASVHRITMTGAGYSENPARDASS